MIVSQQDAERITAGRKTQLRIPRHRRAPSPGRTVPITFHDPVQFSDRVLAVEACRIKIVERWETQLFNITNAEVEAEGYIERDVFLAQWGHHNFDVWALRFRLDDSHRPRLLTNRIVAGHQGAYVESPVRALPDEPEAVDEETQEWITRDANYGDRRREEERRRIRAELPFDQQLKALQQEAWTRHIDIRSELRAIKRWREPAVQQRQLEIIRGKLETPVPSVA